MIVKYHHVFHEVHASVIQVLFFGDLGKKIALPGGKESSPVIVQIEPTGVHRVSDILDKYKINHGDTSHIFVNSVYSGFSKLVKDGDRVGIFPRNMGLLYKWYFTRAEDG